MDEQRIKQAENNFRVYLDEGKIKKVPKIDKLVYETYLRNARESLKVANQLTQNKTSSLWVIVTSYYSMFYMACAYLYKLGYKSSGELVHQVINEALIVQGRHKLKNYLLETEKTLGFRGVQEFPDEEFRVLDNYNEEKDRALVIVDSYLDNYEKEKAKRSSFQYETTEEIKEAKAQNSLNRAKEFLTLIEEILTSKL